MTKLVRLYLCSGVIFALLSVVFGAFGAHALKAILSANMMVVFDTAVQYQMFHSLALIFLGVLMHLFADTYQQSKRFSLAGKLFLVGIILFCGSLYALAISGIKILGAVTPLGGLAFILAWLVVLYSLLKTSEQ